MPREMAINGLNTIKSAILAHLENNFRGATNTDIANALELQSYSSISESGKVTAKNFLSHAILGIMERDGQLIKRGSRYLRPEYVPK